MPARLSISPAPNEKEPHGVEMLKSCSNGLPGGNVGYPAARPPRSARPTLSSRAASSLSLPIAPSASWNRSARTACGPDNTSPAITTNTSHRLFMTPPIAPGAGRAPA